jgi:class 3 adenylate cyclase
MQDINKNKVLEKLNKSKLCNKELKNELLNLLNEDKKDIELKKIFSNILTFSPATSGENQLPYVYSNYDKDFIVKFKKLIYDITSAREEIEAITAELQGAKTDLANKDEIISKLQSKIRNLDEKEKLTFLLPKVNEEAKNCLLKDANFQKKFLETKECLAFIMSVDIRRSTELMLKARSPEKFAHFITDLCSELEKVIKENFGIFDKFTGDGILAFFPDFFSGEDAGFFAISAADRCHKLFMEKYKEYRSSFNSVLTNTGLGIGIDYGLAHLVEMAGGLTVVGVPVVYACRLSGSPAGITLLNQPAYESINKKFSAYCFFHETELDIKNEGSILGYEVSLNKNEYTPRNPDWAFSVQEEISPDLQNLFVSNQISEVCTYTIPSPSKSSACP